MNDRNVDSKHNDTVEDNLADCSPDSDSDELAESEVNPEVKPEIEPEVTVETIRTDDPRAFRFFKGFEKPIHEIKKSKIKKRSIWVGSRIYRELGFIDVEGSDYHG